MTLTRPAPFDRAAENYDQTRGFPPGIADLVGDAALEILGAGRRVLEVGIGTGRVAKPLLARGLHVTGVDLARRMMARLLESLPPGVAPPDLIEGEAARLPLAPGVFDAVISVHVFHLVADWRDALRETRRVLKPGGAFLTGYDWRPPGAPGTLVFERWREIVRANGLDDHHPGTNDFSDIKSALLEMGAQMQEWSVGEWTRTRTPAQYLESIEHRTWSSTWGVPDDFFPRCLAELRAWTEQRFGSLERELPTPHHFIWQRFIW
ncbi:MAG: methyltransferase domain-containing protein [Chloroflexi bacterium]|nr:methyltransferase domain-containing protein [Chloroflexota bacterium]